MTTIRNLTYLAQIPITFLICSERGVLVQLSPYARMLGAVPTRIAKRAERDGAVSIAPSTRDPRRVVRYLGIEYAIRLARELGTSLGASFADWAETEAMPTLLADPAYLQYKGSTRAEEQAAAQTLSAQAPIQAYSWQAPRFKMTINYITK